jgi:hypothetical protein
MAQQTAINRGMAVGVLGALALAAPALADPVLTLVPLPGPGVTIALRFTNIGPVPAAGWQAFLEFDASRLTFVSGAYETSHFGLPLTAPTVNNINRIDLAAGINAFLGQAPSNVDQDVAYLTFSPSGTGCLPQIRVRTTNPPSRLTDTEGTPIGSLETISPWSNCLPDFNRSGALSVQDIFDFLNAWFAGECAADFNGMGGLSVADIFDFLNAWFAGCP